jgi:hypothetical protein
MIEGDDVLAAKDEGMFHGVLELPHIAGPGMLDKSFQDIRGYGLNGFLEFSVEPVSKVINQRRDVFTPLPQRRQPDLNHLQPLVEAFSQVAKADFLHEICVRCSDRPNVHPGWRRASGSFKFPVFKDAQELHKTCFEAVVPTSIASSPTGIEV